MCSIIKEMNSASHNPQVVLDSNFHFSQHGQKQRNIGVIIKKLWIMIHTEY